MRAEVWTSNGRTYNVSVPDGTEFGPEQRAQIEAAAEEHLTRTSVARNEQPTTPEVLEAASRTLDAEAHDRGGAAPDQ